LNELPYTPIKDDYYVTASFLAPYKRADLVVEAFTRMARRRLVVVGKGQQLAKLRSIAGPNVEFRGHLSREEYVATVAGAKAFVFAGCEDFGIALAEAQACGTPLIAFGRGGACDIVRPLGCSTHPTGITFGRQSAEAVQEAVEHFEAWQHSVRPRFCRENALRFSLARFRDEIEAAVDEVMTLHSHPVRRTSVVDHQRILA
jgi:glycosyltransferase involved in cell wall biosynthesis